MVNFEDSAPAIVPEYENELIVHDSCMTIVIKYERWSVGGKVSLSSRRTKRTRSPRANYSSLTLTPYSLDASIKSVPLTEWIRLPSDAARAHYAGWKLLHLQRRTHPLSPLRCRRAEVREGFSPRARAKNWPEKPVSDPATANPARTTGQTPTPPSRRKT